MRPRSLLSSLSTFVLLSFVLTACDSCDKKETPSTDSGATSVTPATEAGATAAADASAVTDAGMAAAGDAGAKHDMGNCPTAVTGATVAIKDVEGGVEVAVTSKDEAAMKEIRARMTKIAEADKNDAGGGAKHDHSGSGGGTTGRCTIIMRNTKLAIAEIPDGAKVTITPKDKSELDWLRRETKERDKEAKSAGAEGAGSNRMAHCASAVEGAKSVVKDTKDGVVVTITGPADKVAEIRSRAKHSAENAKKDAGAKVEHSGSGTGGGGLGRCPIDVEGDTSVELKDVDGGVEATIKTKGDVAALQKEVKARATNFTK